MSNNVRVGGVWKENPSTFVRIAGVWTTITKIHVNVGGTWKQIYQNLGSAMVNRHINDFAISPQNTSGSLDLLANGQCQIYEGGIRTVATAWMLGGTGADYDVMLTRTAGTSGGTHNTWMNLATNRGWDWSESRDGYYTTDFTGHLEIRMNAAPQTVFSNTSVTVELVVEV
jgi:hypothetical protein